MEVYNGEAKYYVVWVGKVRNLQAGANANSRSISLQVRSSRRSNPEAKRNRHMRPVIKLLGRGLEANRAVQAPKLRSSASADEEPGEID